MSKRTSDQSTSVKAKITKWLPAKARKESQESIKDEEKPEQGVVNEKSTETEVHAPSASSSVLATSVEAENPSAHIKFLTEPNQPQNFKFPARTFGNQNFKRSFQSSWSDKFEWLHYDADSDSAFCFTCIKAPQHNMISSTKGEVVFTETGFQNGKEALAKNKGLHKHESSECHKEAVARWREIPSTVKGDIGEMISNQHALEKYSSRIEFFKKSEVDSYFYQLLKLRCDDDPSILEWLQKKKSKFTSVDIKNDMLEIMAFRVLHEIARNIQNAVIYTIIADETTDVSNKEQLVFCLRWVDDDLMVHEDFIGMHPMKGTGAD